MFARFHLRQWSVATAISTELTRCPPLRKNVCRFLRCRTNSSPSYDPGRCHNGLFVVVFFFLKCETNQFLCQGTSQTAMRFHTELWAVTLLYVATTHFPYKMATATAMALFPLLLLLHHHQRTRWSVAELTVSRHFCLSKAEDTRGRKPAPIFKIGVENRRRFLTPCVFSLRAGCMTIT